MDLVNISGAPYILDSEEDTSSTGSRLSIDETLPEWQCKYTGKICTNPRARKTNGKLHRLCQQHRIRANINQRNLQQKRRQARAEMMRTPYPPVKAGHAEPLTDGWEDWVAMILTEDELQQPLTGVMMDPTLAEPLTTPSELTDEDVEALTILFTTSATSDVACESELVEALRTIERTSY